MRLTLILLVACGGTAAPPALQGTSAPTAVATTPAPSIRWIDNGFDTTGLPAVAHDGSRLVYAQIDGDGGRGNPNLAIVVKDRKDVLARRLVVLTVDEAETMFDAAGISPALRTRIDDANDALAQLHTAHGLVPLPRAEVPDRPFTDEDAPPAPTPRLSIAWPGTQLEVTRDGQRVSTPPAPRPRRADTRRMCSTCTELCRNEPFLGAAWGDATRAVALIRIDYTGTDLCWEPDAAYHVIAW